MPKNSFYFGLLILLTIYFSSCAPYSMVEVPRPGPKDEKTYDKEAKMIDERIQHLEQTLLSEDLKPIHRQVTEEFIDAYSHLKKLLRLAEGNQSNVPLITGLFQRISLIEERYFAENIIKGEKKDQGDILIQPEKKLSELIREVNQLVQRQAFTEAKMLLIKARIKTDNDSEIQIIDQTLKDIEGTETRIEKGEDPLDYVAKKEAMEQIAALIEAERYEEAMNILEILEGRLPVIDPETQRLKDLAVEKIINRDRNRAAQLYLQAKNISDPQRRKVLLRSCLDILKNLVEKYPSSTLIQRINDHIEIVEKSLNEW